jgi:LacI family transcriptional regulator
VPARTAGVKLSFWGAWLTYSIGPAVGALPHTCMLSYPNPMARLLRTLTIEHIAVLAGVSRSTVSRVVNDHPRVRPDVRERVRRVIEERGYTPHAAARSLAGSRTNVLCLLNVRGAPSLFDGQYMPPLVQGLSESCNAGGYFLLLSIVTAEQATPLYRRLVQGHHCDGIIMLASDVDEALLPHLVADEVPSVLIGRHPRFPDLNTVNVANDEGARLAVRHLIGLGHRRIATITGHLGMPPGGERHEGYQAALREAGLPLDPQLVASGQLTSASGYEAMQRLLALPQRPTAVFAADDAMAAGALQAIRLAGLGVPRDIAVVGFDDAPIASLTDPPLTTVRQPVYELGAEAARLLIAQLRGEAPRPAQRRLPVELVVRQSCGAPCGG